MKKVLVFGFLTLFLAACAPSYPEAMGVIMQKTAEAQLTQDAQSVLDTRATDTARLMIIQDERDAQALQAKEAAQRNIVSLNATAIVQNAQIQNLQIAAATLTAMPPQATMEARARELALQEQQSYTARNTSVNYALVALFGMTPWVVIVFFVLALVLYWRKRQAKVRQDEADADKKANEAKIVVINNIVFYPVTIGQEYDPNGRLRPIQELRPVLNGDQVLELPPGAIQDVPTDNAVRPQESQKSYSIVEDLPHGTSEMAARKAAEYLRETIRLHNKDWKRLATHKELRISGQKWTYWVSWFAINGMVQTTASGTFINPKWGTASRALDAVLTGKQTFKVPPPDKRGTSPTNSRGLRTLANTEQLRTPAD